jgi:hypothetical protein
MNSFLSSLNSLFHFKHNKTNRVYIFFFSFLSCTVLYIIWYIHFHRSKWREGGQMLICHVRSDVSLTSADVRPQVIWRSWRSCGKYDSLKICLIHFKFCVPSSSQAGLQEDDIQKLHTTTPEQLNDQELLLSTISAADQARKHSGG